MKLVILESPYAGDVENNLQYARQCIADCLRMGEAPIASHLLYTQQGILDDKNPDERALGIEAGLSWYKVASLCVVYVDNGISSGMFKGINRAHCLLVPVQYRRLKNPASTEADGAVS